MAAKYQNIFEVPEPFRTFQGARLSLDQINEIMVETDELTPDSLTGIAVARENFTKEHHIDNNIWVDGPDPSFLKEGVDI